VNESDVTRLCWNSTKQTEHSCCLFIVYWWNL